MNIRGYLRWQFAGSLSSPTFYAFMLIALGAVAALGGCPAPWPSILMVSGVALTIIDAGRAWFRFSYGIYEMERKQIIRDLERKEK